jgi:hypothetical protein
LGCRRLGVHDGGGHQVSAVLRRRLLQRLECCHQRKARSLVGIVRVAPRVSYYRSRPILMMSGLA